MPVVPTYSELSLDTLHEHSRPRDKPLMTSCTIVRLALVIVMNDHSPYQGIRSFGLDLILDLLVERFMTWSLTRHDSDRGWYVLPFGVGGWDE